MVIQKNFLGGSSMKKCDLDCDQALIKSSWRPVKSMHISVSSFLDYIGVNL